MGVCVSYLQSLCVCECMCVRLVEISRQKRPRCNAISHRANGSEIADSSVYARKTLQKTGGSVESLLINMVFSEDVLHLNCLIV